MTERTNIPDESVLSALAHEFRTPLGVITGYAELLKLRDDPELRREGLARIEEAAQRLARAVDRLLSVVQTDSDRVAERIVGPLREMQLPERSRHRLAHVPQRRHEPADKGTTRILVVDDDDELRELLVYTLPPDGFEILEARDGREALELVEQRAPDLLVLDWNMPHASGGDVLARLKGLELGIPVIVLTADSDPGCRHTAESLGADAYLEKPFSPLELIGVIERLVE